jgi:glycosyltransferase involved in cell wall biosynthesis
MLALDMVGVDVVSRTVKLNDNNPTIPDKILEFEDKNLNNVDFVVQHILPHHYQWTNKCPNIGFYLNDMSSLFNNRYWSDKIALMDAMWYPNKNSRDCCINYFNNRTKIIPHPCDVSIYDKKLDKTNLGHHNGNYIFYFIGELISRKNIKQLIQAFNTEFSNDEPVSLLLKVNKSGINSDTIMDILSKEINIVKNGLKLHSRIDDYSSEIIIAGQISEEEIQQIHQTCDCYVNCSHGEAWSIPTFEACCYGKDIIAPFTNSGHYYDYLSEYDYYKLNATEDSVFDYKDTFFELGNSKEYWLSYRIEDLRKCMREAFNNRGVKERNFDKNKYSLESVGKLMKEYFENYA